ncbi:MAG TPA: UV DNA damage repair endonuclease UvsE [Bacteroidetes bacterium]|nr:UV DNA damage repair endonuclease UvsE [Bacteroidota bacterium]
MRLRHLGYACQNLTLGTKSRTVRLANVRTETLIPVITQNLEDVERALRWNLEHGLRFFRISSDLIPFGPMDVFPFDWEEAFAWKLKSIRKLVRKEKLRVTSHPGQYTVLNSPRPEVVDASVDELEHQARVLRAMDPKGTMTLHVGGAYGDKPAALERFEQNLARLSDDARQRLAIENDDTTWDLPEVVELAERTGLRVIPDLFHHLVFPDDTLPDEELAELLERAAATWGRGVMKLHLSSQKPGTRVSHADFLDMDDVDRLLALMDRVGDADAPYDVMLEAKRKEKAVLEVRRYLETGERPARALPMETVEEAG